MEEQLTLLKENVEKLLRNVGIKEGQTVLDFGCGADGNYTIPAARIVGRKGRVYSIDKEAKSLLKLVKKSKSERLENIAGIVPSGELTIPLANKSVDVILLYDVLHLGYFSEAVSRTRILNEAHRVVKPKGFISVYPTHLRKYAMTFRKVLREIKDAGFDLKGEIYRRLVHDNRLVRGRIFKFSKK